MSGANRKAMLICLLASLLCALTAIADDGQLVIEKQTRHAAHSQLLVESPIDDTDREHWAFAPLVRPTLPAVQSTAWPINAIDLFVLSQLEEHDLHPAPSAAAHTLLRRLKFDLLGLPPTPEELDEFLADTSGFAYERLVDRWLASPAYGERWGQHWLDLARFAETDGFEHDKLRPNAWKYRQWVIDALNEDMPYSQFIGLQLAGDALDPTQHAIATSFCVAGPDMPDINEQDLRRHDKLNEITATIGASLLGLQMGCAQCHDHKYDPISHADFYRLRAIFESSVPPLKRDQPLLELSAQSGPAVAHLYHRGELYGRGAEVQPAPPRIACGPESPWSDSPRNEVAPDPRLRFVEWMFRPNHPLVARVIVNRVWQHHFGKGFSGNPSDFGVLDSGPTHPQLMDWLAVELQATGWSLKELHRLIVLSATYRQASSTPRLDATARFAFQKCAECDPDNRLYGRFARRRLEGEVVRDALFTVAGTANHEYGGPSVMPPLPEELESTLLKGQWLESSEPADHFRRSVYVFARRNLRYPLFDVFDRPDAGASCPQRNTSTTPLQSLQLLNSDLAVASARSLSQQLLQLPHRDDYRAVADHLFRLTLARRPTPEEVQLVTDALNHETQDDGIEERLFVLSLAMLNSNEFIYID